MKPFEKLLNDMRSGICQVMFKMLGFDANYTAEQLFQIENLFQMKFHGKEVFDSTFVPFGFYYGETMIRAIPGAYWSNLNQPSLFEITVTVPTKEFDLYCIKPFQQFHNFYIDSTERPSSQLWMTEMFHKHTYAELTKMGEPLTDGWYKFPQGHMIQIKEELPKPTAEA